MRPRHQSSPDRRRPSPGRRSRISSSHIGVGPPPGPPVGPPGPPPPMGYPPMMHPYMVPPHPHSPPYRNGMMLVHPPSPPEEPEPEAPTPICRCRVLYLGSSVPHVTKDGLQGIQEPLRELYPEEGALGAKGIDSWLSVWSNGFLLENVDENRKKVTRFFPVESLHYCAAVRYVLVPNAASSSPPGSPPGEAGGQQVQRFLPLDSPFARNPSANHPPLFAAILRRTTGIKVLECHVFICKRETAANALVRCAFHAYADSTYAKHLESGGGQSIYGTIGGPTPVPPPSATPTGAGGGATGATHVRGTTATMTMGAETQQSVLEVSADSIDSIEKVEEWKMLSNGSSPHKKVPNGTPSPRENGNGTSLDEISVVNGGDENHKVWPGSRPEHHSTALGSPNGGGAEGNYDYGSTMRSIRSSASGLSHRNRPRQMMMPSSPPPPPIPEESKDHHDGSVERKKEKKRKQRRSKSRDNVDHGMTMMMMNGEAVPRGGGGSHSVVSGPTMGSRKHSVSSLNAGGGFPPPHPHHVRMNGHGPPRGMPPPPHMMMGGTLPPKKSGTFSARGKGSSSSRGMPPPFMMYGPPPPHPGFYGPPPPGAPPHLMPPPGHPIYNMGPPGRPMEEPIYMPHAARPMSPVASYQPGHFPHEAYYSQQQYATVDRSNKYRKNRPPKASSASAAGKSSTGTASKHHSSDSNADDSDFNQAGIYKKGHINERAFSYSIRNEHRSRSHGSLANTPYESGAEGGPVPSGPPLGPGASNGDLVNNGHGPPKPDDRMMAHMMSDLELADDAIERSEVPPGMYGGGGGRNGGPRGGGPNGNMVYGPPHPHPHMMMMPDPVMVHHQQNGGKKKR